MLTSYFVPAIKKSGMCETSLPLETLTVFLAAEKAIAKVLATLNDPNTIAKLEEEYVSAFNEIELAEAGLIAADDEGVHCKQLWLDDRDLGVEDFRDCSIDAMKRDLGVHSLPSDTDEKPRPCLPFMASHVGAKNESLRSIFGKDLPSKDQLDRKGCVPMNPFWHQYVGLCAMVKRAFQGENVILADGVGVGKTLTCMMLLSWSRYHACQSEKGECMPPIGESQPTSAAMINPIDTLLAGDAKYFGRPYFDDNDNEITEDQFPKQGNEGFVIVVPNMLVAQWVEELNRFLDMNVWQVLEYKGNAELRRKFWTDVWEAKSMEKRWNIVVVPVSVCTVI